MLVRVWKYNALTVAAYILSVLLALHPANVPIAGWKNVVVAEFFRQLSKLNSKQYRDSLVVKNGPGGI